MPTTWGTQTINIFAGTFKPTFVPDTGINEIEVLPSKDILNPRTVLQQAGRARKRIKFEGFVRGLNDYDALLTDFINGTEKTFLDSETGISFSSIIIALSEPEFVNATVIRYSMEVIEA